MSPPEVDVQAASEALRAMARRVVAARRESRDIIGDQAEALAELYALRDRDRHAQHKAWQRSRFGRWFAHHAYALGLISGSSFSHSATCNGCVKLYWRGSRPYILGKPREWWECLRYGHIYAPIPDSWLCAKCAPCPACQSSDPRHDSWACETAGEVSS